MINYKMHELQPTEFEELCVAILHHTISPLVAVYSKGKDGGRDAFLEISSHEIDNISKVLAINLSNGEKIVFQFKHVSKEGSKFSFKVIKNEIHKLQKLIKLKEIDYYVILTNYSLGAESEIEIKKTILEKVKCLKGCKIFGKEWLDLTVNQNYNLQRYLPFAFNLGDVNYNTDHRLRQQSQEYITEWNKRRSSFEETAIYLEAYNKVKKEKVLILSGQPQAGKTSIVLNICASIMEENKQFSLLILKLNEFKTYYNPSDIKKIYLFDDVFGRRQVEDSRLIDIDETLFFLGKAIESGSIVIFTSRDYILKEVIDNSILTGAVANPLYFFADKNILNIESYSLEEKENILLKQVNMSDLETRKKIILKMYSKRIISLVEFTPELVRRLVDTRLNKNIEFTLKGIQDFFEKPTTYLLDLYDELDLTKKTALLIMLMNEGELLLFSDNEFLEEKAKLLQEEISPLKIKKSLPYIPNSLIRQEFHGNKKVWKFHHPSIEEALLIKLVDKVKKNELLIEAFIRVSDFRTLIDNITMCPEREKRIFVSEEFWGITSVRLFKTRGIRKSDFDYFKDSDMFRKEDLVRFFAYQTNDCFLKWFDEYFSDSTEVWNYLVSKSIFAQLYNVGAYRLAYRLDELKMISIKTKLEVIADIMEVAKMKFDVSFLKEDYMKKLIGEEAILELLEYYKDEGIYLALEEMNDIFEEIESDAYNKESFDLYFESWFDSIELLKDKLREVNFLSLDLECEFDNLLVEVEQRRQETIEQAEIDSEEDFTIHMELLSEYITKAIHASSKNDLVQLVNELVNKMIIELSYNWENAIVYVGEALSEKNIQEYQVIRNLEKALYEYIKSSVHDK